MKELPEGLMLLQGQWEGILGDGVYHEEWSLTDDGNLSGRAYVIRKGEISDTEKLALKEESGDVFYIADVSHNAAPVKFRLTEDSGKIFVFENPQHDFPQKITYDLTNENNLLATIEAERDGKQKKILFDLKRIA